MSKNKKELGQFYTKNANYLIQDLLSFVPNEIENIIDPFAGEGDLLNLIPKSFNIVGYDIEPKKEEILFNDSLKNPIKYSKKDWILTNPPYLAKNKTTNKEIFTRYQVDDLYLASLKSIEGSLGGIFILPSSFFTNSNVSFRKSFLQKYKIIKIYFFEEQVFSDTSYTVCSFAFKQGNGINEEIPVIFFPEQKKSIIVFNETNNYTFGGEIFIQNKSKIKISRLLIGQTPNSNIKLYAIDSGSPSGKIRLSLEDPFYGKNTDRAFATICFSKNYSLEDQQKIVDLFNEKLNFYRNKYNSMFLTNYRNSTINGARKRIGFEQTYSLLHQIIKELNLE